MADRKIEGPIDDPMLSKGISKMKKDSTRNAEPGTVLPDAVDRYYKGEEDPRFYETPQKGKE